MVIVTQNQYILASKIHHVTLDEQCTYIEVKNTRGRRYRTVKQPYWQLTVVYSPDNINTNSVTSSRDEYRECSVTIHGAVNAHKIFKDLIQQVREQMPDALYLDKALERMITGTDIKSLEDKDLDIEEALKDDQPTKKVRRARKKKRRS